MPRPRKSVPSYLHHKASGRAYCIIRQADGTPRGVYLGEYGSPESKAAYARALLEHHADVPARPVTPRQDKPEEPPPVAPCGPITISELILRFLNHAETYYRREDGTHTNEVNDYRLSLRPLRFLFGDLSVSEFGPLALQRVRDLMVRGYEHPDYGPQKALSRKVINQRIDRIKRTFRWGTSQEIVPPSVTHGLASVAGLKAGRCQARETEAIEPVSLETVNTTLPKLNAVLRAMVELQALTGMRPGEVCAMRADEIDRRSPIWIYTPTQHKTAYRGKRRTIHIGPRGQAILAPFLEKPTGEFIFSPSAAVEQVNAHRRANRKSKMTPSQKARKRKKKPERTAGERYSIASYQRAIARAAAQAGVEHWHPNQLRHTFATQVRATFGLEAAQVALGHAQANVTQVYAERDSTLAARVAEQIG